MLDALRKKISPELFSALTEKFNFNEEMGIKTVEATFNSLHDTISDEIIGGNLDGLLSMFKSDGASSENETFASLIRELSGGYIQKLGLSPDLSHQISEYALPLVLAKLTSMAGGKIDKESLTHLLGEKGVMEKAGNLIGGLISIFQRKKE